ncbi:bacillithiol biosynthesis deacetylase BshB1 [Paenibacillus sp. N1-5-1-14]|uniref:bacillithiol biosynthesis deacetylase BshB1 n=1 Tax=Paenibacillus radicibacter TaxID=2972488 RepID=UPI002158B7B3|nr:bacillithiol biosynthesis deacetylase BshB1 [Paenibacillus radicibacter]MCR8642254.1 bacillithiol biosynthesis deacetylase BshB1 [Paenibacillus radicibacter]
MDDHLDILIFGAHPDDAEIGMGGTIAKHTAAGYKVGMCDLTYAEMSSNGTVESRIQEANAASKVLHLHMRSNLGLPDRGLQLIPDHIEAVTREIRKHRPSILFAPYWEDRHPDHVMCSRIVQEALFNAKLRKYLPDMDAHLVSQVYFYFINDVHEADVLTDVTAFYEQKLDSLRAYQTQFNPAGSSNDYVATPLNQSYMERVEARDYLLGQKGGVRFAEGFVTKQPLFLDYFGLKREG